MFAFVVAVVIVVVAVVVVVVVAIVVTVVVVVVVVVFVVVLDVDFGNVVFFISLDITCAFGKDKLQMCQSASKLPHKIVISHNICQKQMWVCSFIVLIIHLMPLLCCLLDCTRPADHGSSPG